MKRYKIRLTLTEPLLGTVPKNPDIYESFILSKAADLGDGQAAEELATVERVEERGWTGFHKDKHGRPFLYDYQIKGFFKGACSALMRVPSTESKKLRAYKKVIDGLLFVEPRAVQIQLSGKLYTIERPLRASTPQGERVTLARSDAAPAGTVLLFTVVILGGISKKLLTEWLNYGMYSGIGQWRNSGMGRFTYTLEELREG